MSVSKSVVVIGAVAAVAAAAGGIAWKTRRADGPRGVVVQAQEAMAKLEFDAVRGLMSTVAQQRFASSMFDEVNDLRSKAQLAKVLELPAEKVRNWDAWQYLFAIAKHQQKLTVAGVDVASDLKAMQDIFRTAEVGDESIDGDRAVVSVKLVTATETRTGAVDLVREREQWRLHYIRWGKETPLWDPTEDSPSVRQRKQEARSEARAVLAEVARLQSNYFRNKSEYAKTFKELGFVPEPGNRYAYYLANAGPRHARAGEGEFSEEAVIIDYDHSRHLGQVDLKSFEETRCSLTLKIAEGGMLAGPGLSRVGGREHFVVVAAAKLDLSGSFDCWSVSSANRIAVDGSTFWQNQPAHETAGEPFVPTAAEPEAPTAAKEPATTSRPKSVSKGTNAPSAPASLTTEKPTVMGSLSPDVIWASIRRQAGSVARCAQGPTGRISVKFVINADGKVATAAVSQSTVGNSLMEACLVDLIRLWRFPKPPQSGVVIVTYPFMFTSESAK